MHPLGRPLLDEIALGAAAVAVLAFLLTVVALTRVRRLRRVVTAFDSSDGKHSVLESVRRSESGVAEMRRELATARDELERARHDIADALRHVAVVRYDAFGDMGGRLSFTAALLDDSGDGLVLTSIHGRSEARTYAKGVTASTSESPLSPEEQQAIELAMRGPGKR